MSGSALSKALVPAHIGRYEILDTLGAGGMARVYLAVQRGAAATKLVVLKCMHAELAREPAFVAMFVDESRIAVRMNHPNVIHAYEASKIDNQYFIAMEFLEGKTLNELVAAMAPEPLPLDVHLWLLCEVLSGLAYAHELADFDGTSLGIVHRDVNPSNVFLTRTGAVKLVDFGVAKLSGGTTAKRGDSLTGTVGYVAPEQCLSDVVDARSDLYSVGVMLWEAVAGRHRARGDTAMANIQARVLDLEPDIAQIRPDLAPELATIVRRALAFDPSLRYQSAAEFRSDLQRYSAASHPPQRERELAALIVEYFDDDMTQLRRVIGAMVDSQAPPSRIPLTRAASHSARDSLPKVPVESLRSVALSTRAQVRPRQVPALAVLGLVVFIAAGFSVSAARRAGKSSQHPIASARVPFVVASVASGTALKSASSPFIASSTAVFPVSSSPAAVHSVPDEHQPNSLTLPTGRGVTPAHRDASQPFAARPIEPGADLGRPSSADRPKRALDESDPYLSH